VKNYSAYSLYKSYIYTVFITYSNWLWLF